MPQYYSLDILNRMHIGSSYLLDDPFLSILLLHSKSFAQEIVYLKRMRAFYNAQIIVCFLHLNININP